ncbi:MAG: 30S ribosomal protein S12 methylthiotransferase RimO [Candidatus Muiribacteriota bacterium]
MIKVFVQKLGCSKNDIDAEHVEYALEQKKFKITDNASEADIVIVNTCCFIESAKKESIQAILEHVKSKIIKKSLKIIVTGCLAQRYADDISYEIPEIDGLIGVYPADKIINVIEEVFKSEKQIKKVSDKPSVNFNSNLKRLNRKRFWAELKIADGCNNFCSYCIIPYIRGKYKSRSLKKCAQEAFELSLTGVKEIILIAQETTKYGVDLYSDYKLTQLLENISKIEKIKWIRIMYASIWDINEKIINLMKSNKKILPYFDIPLQNVNRDILKKMNRRGSEKEIVEKINWIRSQIPEICIRTTLITGFPGETEEIFNQNIEFLKKMKLDRVGVFKYSSEEGTKASELSNKLSDGIIQNRHEELMLTQLHISNSINKKFIKKTMEVLVEGFENDLYVGRSYRDAPEVDGFVFFEGKNIKIGDFVQVKITDCNDYDLYGEQII